ncbi:MAG: hypothetical protein NTW42_00370 [Deltaproteobacteria bacterium]|nr:hypothetical protein [Deltaproteobacteria bacterium]
MNISVVPSTQGAYGTTFTQKTSKPVAESASGRSGGDSVNISDEAWTMAKKAKAEDGGQVKNGTALTGSFMDGSRDELMYIPEAYSNLLPDTVPIVKIGAPAYTGRELTSEELKNQNEYTQMLSNVFYKERHNNGVQSIEDYQNLTRNNDKLIDEIYQAVKGRLAADPRAIELMKQFGIS